MCVILVGKITKEQYEAALKQNGDGFSVFSKKLGLVKQPSKKLVKQAIGDFAIWHFRIASSGVIDVTNVHPFPVCKGQWLLYHNGVLGVGLGDKSDTQALADLLYDSPFHTVRSTLASLSENNRFLLVNAKDPTDFITIGRWVVDAGVLMSHRMYKEAFSLGSSKPVARSLLAGWED